MTGPRAPFPAETAEHPLRASLARGEALAVHSARAMKAMMFVNDHSLVTEAIVAQAAGMIENLAAQLASHGSGSAASAAARTTLFESLLRVKELRVHCHGLALEWHLSLSLEQERALDPVLSPMLQLLVEQEDEGTAALAMAALTAQARFAQAQRRMELSLAELPAELFHHVLAIARDIRPGWEDETEWELRTDFDEGTGRLALLARLSLESAAHWGNEFAVEKLGVALWLSALRAHTGEDRERLSGAAANPHPGRLLLVLRAAGMSPGEAERQVLFIHPNAEIPTGLQDVGTREAAQWLGEACR